MSDLITSQPISHDLFDEGNKPSDRQLCIDLAVCAGDWSAFEPIDHLIMRVSEILKDADLDWPTSNCEAALVLSDNKTVQALNLKFRNINKPTNVLSFPSYHIAAKITDTYFLGDVILASETVLREAIERSLEPSHHLVHLIIHGILHLLGYDHENAAEADVMEQIETQLLVKLGLSDPYSDDNICQQQLKETGCHQK